MFVVTGRAQPTSAESVVDSQQAARIERAALSAAHSALTHRVLTLPVDRERAVGDLLVGELSKDRALRRWVRATPAAETRHSVGVCEVRLVLPVAAICERLRVLFERTGEPDSGTSASDAIDWEGATRPWNDIEATGRATSEEAADAPIGWEDVSEDKRALTRRAAEADARRALFDAAARLRVTQARVVSEFLAAGDAVRREVMRGIDDAATVTTRLEPDQVAVSDARIALADLIHILIQVHSQHYRGDLFRGEHFREMALLVRAPEISASGYAVPPPSERLPQPPIDATSYEIAGHSQTAGAGDGTTAAGDLRAGGEAGSKSNPTSSADEVAIAGNPLRAASQPAAIPPAASQPARITAATEMPKLEAVSAGTQSAVEKDAEASGGDSRQARVPGTHEGGQQPAQPELPAETVIAAHSNAPAFDELPARDRLAGAPAWAAKSLRVVGRGGTASDPAQAVEFARRAAVRALRDGALELEVERDLTIGAVLGYRDDLRPAFEAALAGAKQVGNPVRRTDGGLDLTMELPLRRIWLAMHSNDAAMPYATDEDTQPSGGESRPATRTATQPASRPKE